MMTEFKKIQNPKIELEQYQTPEKTAQDFLKKIELKEKIVLDLGCGNGVLGITALKLGAKKCFFVDIDEEAIETAKKNFSKLKNKNAEFIKKDVSLIKKSLFSNLDIVVMNPPFGTKEKFIDHIFLKKAMKLANTVLTIHKTSTKDYIKKIITKNNFKIMYEEDFLFPIPKIYKQHKLTNFDVKTTCFIIKKNEYNK